MLHKKKESVSIYRYSIINYLSVPKNFLIYIYHCLTTSPARKSLEKLSVWKAIFAISGELLGSLYIPLNISKDGKNSTITIIIRAALSSIFSRSPLATIFSQSENLPFVPLSLFCTTNIISFHD